MYQVLEVDGKELEEGNDYDEISRRSAQEMPCIFPFIYRNKTYTSCTNDGNDEDVQVMVCVTGLGYITMIWIIGIWPYFPKTRLAHYNHFSTFPGALVFNKDRR